MQPVRAPISCLFPRSISLRLLSPSYSLAPLSALGTLGLVFYPAHSSGRLSVYRRATSLQQPICFPSSPFRLSLSFPFPFFLFFFFFLYVVAVLFRLPVVVVVWLPFVIT